MEKITKVLTVFDHTEGAWSGLIEENMIEWVKLGSEGEREKIESEEK